MHAHALLVLFAVSQLETPTCPPSDAPRDIVRDRTERERQTMPYMPGTGRTAPSRHVQFGPHVSIQVNVDANGNNILDDAANEPSIAVDPTNPYRMAIGWRQFDSVLSNFRQAGYGYSTDGGRHWTFPGVLEVGAFRSDPVLAAGPDGTFFFNSVDVNTFNCDVFRSYDHGQTWPYRTPAFGGDKAWMVIDHTDGAGRGNIYCDWTGGSTKSVDGGVSWMGPWNYYRYLGTLAVRRNGELCLAGVGGTSAAFSKSLNASDPQSVPTYPVERLVSLGGSTGAYGGPNPDGILGQVWVACDHPSSLDSNNIYITSTVGSIYHTSVGFSRSTDGGLTWDHWLRINTDPNLDFTHHWFTTMSVAPNGRIDIIWNDTRHSPENWFISELFYSCSSDGGLTWSPNEQLSPAWDSSVGWPQQAKIGDYYHMISDDLGANLAYAATFNGEQDVWFLRIGDYPCLGLITQQPASPSICQNSTVSLRATANPRGSELTYHWRKNGTPLSDSAAILGTQSPTLVLLHAQPADTGSYDCYVKLADCGAEISHTATLTVYPSGSADLNNDGAVNALDIAPFLAALVNHDPVSAALCAADLTGEGIVNDADIEPFVSRLLAS